MKNNYPLERVGKLQEIKKWNGVKKKDVVSLAALRRDKRLNRLNFEIIDGLTNGIS